MNLLDWQIEKIKIPYYVGDNCFKEIAEAILTLKPDTLFIITDTNLKQLHLAELINSFQSDIVINKYILASGEKEKTLKTVSELTEKILKDGATRQSVIIPFGGGVVGNIGGLVAALLYRGIRLVHIPTTFLAMHDSVTSMKQAVNHNGTKNIIGTYYLPTGIYADIRVLSTLPQKHIYSGIYELVKNALIFGGDHYTNVEKILSHGYNQNDYLSLIKLGVKAKLQPLIKDKHEKREAIVFEYGHTIGHVFELLKSPDIAHGKAVAIGMLYAGLISYELGYLSGSELEKHQTLINSVDNLTVPKIDARTVIEFLYKDNKRGYIESQNKITMLLLNKIGKFAGDKKSNYLTKIDDKVIYKILTSKLI